MTTSGSVARMTSVPERAGPNHDEFKFPPADYLNRQTRAVLKHAIDAHKNKLKVYESLRNLNEVVGTEYGDRVLYELIQNAHDAHQPSDQGRIAVKLVVRSETSGTLYIANGGSGFREKDVIAIQNLATTAKEIGEGIGNKGLGFRSIEALTDDVHIFSRRGREESPWFDGYCFRFANTSEIEESLREDGIHNAVAHDVAETVPRYLVPLPLAKQPEDILSYARRGYASVIALPLRTAEAVELAKRQVLVLADLDVPLLLFLDRITDFHIDVETPDEPMLRRRLSRRQRALGDVPGVAGCRMDEVQVGEDRRFLVVRYEVDKPRVLDAVRRSLSTAPQMKRWLDWKGQPTISVAVGLSPRAVVAGRFYNFLPMADTAVAPLHGHLDAPFFAGIDRRKADVGLPLNVLLIAAAAEACAYTALYLARQTDTRIPQRTVFDLIAWTGEHAGKLDEAFKGVGSSLADAPVVPAIRVDDTRWASLSDVSIWPADTFSLMKPTDVARRTGARLVSAELDDGRLNRLQAMANRLHRQLSPSGEQLAEWAKRFAESLAERNAKARTWSRFYEDLRRVFQGAGEKLDALAGAPIFVDRSKQSKKLLSGGEGGGASRTRVFVRSEASKRQRSKDGVPLPPATLSRRYKFLDENIRFRPGTLGAFIEADLLREYDPVEALAGLGSALATRANDNRRREALLWAFSVWRTAGAGIRSALHSARLHVPTAGGWRPATEAAFSSSWTPVGRILENFLVETSDLSADCRQARKALLLDLGDSLAGVVSSKRQWVEFLTLLGVTDGLRPVAARLPEENDGYGWNQLLRDGDPKEGLDKDWCVEAAHARFDYPYTMYQRMQEAWRLPGQIEHGELRNAAKEAFHELAFKHLEAHNNGHLRFSIGRFDRRYKQDRRTLPTPLATFLRSKAWISAGTHEDLGFRRARESWAARSKRDRPPRFMERVSDTGAALIEGKKELGDLVFSEALGLRDWHGKDSASARLEALAIVAPSLAAHDRPDFRKEYRRAWHDVLDAEVAVPHDLDLAVSRDGRLETLSGDAAMAPVVIVTQSAQTFEARILSSAGRALLDVGEASVKKVTERLAATGRFTPRQVDGIDVQLLVDSEPFVPRTSDPLLTSHELGWLPELVLLGHEILAEGLERGVLRNTVDRRIRAIRVRRCQTMALLVDEKDVSPGDTMRCYGFEHAELPTLILSDQISLAWRTLGRDLSRTIARLIDTRLRFLEPLLLRLALDRDPDRLDAPDDEALASALGCDERTLHEHRAALRTDLGRVLHLLLPVVAYFADVALARQLESDAERASSEFDLVYWLRARFSRSELEPQELIEVCRRVPDRVVLRKELGLDYERFNRALLALGESALSNEAELRSIYEAYLRDMRPRILERLRRHHAADFREGRDLALYVKRKSLAFLEFDPLWILARESLDSETVEGHVAKLLDELLGKDQEVDLPASHGLVERNRKLVRAGASGAISVVRAWCRRNRIPIPEPWGSEDPQSVTRHLENAGLLDFEPVQAAQIPVLCHRAACWPQRMPLTLDPASLGLDRATVVDEERRRESDIQRKIIEKRTIEFAGSKLDTANPVFAESFRRLAENSISSDSGWFDRSRRPRLAQFAEPGAAGGPPRSGTSTWRRRGRTPPNELKGAMGLASEWLAFQFLRRRYGDTVDETCWVSTNRAHFCGGGEGDDSAGYDFCVKTPQAERLFEVKSSLEDTGEFELTPNEMRVAASLPRRGRRRYRILYVPFVFSPDRWMVLELPNPMADGTRSRFRQVGRGSVRFRFQR